MTLGRSLSCGLFSPWVNKKNSSYSLGPLQNGKKTTQVAELQETVNRCCCYNTDDDYFHLEDDGAIAMGTLHAWSYSILATALEGRYFS